MEVRRPRTSRRPRRALVATASGLVLVLAGCASATGSRDAGSPTSSSPPSTTAATPSPPVTTAGDHVDADVRFAVTMLPHHLQALEMADLVWNRSSDPEVLAIADRIRAEQGAQVQLLTGWLGAWGADPEMGHDDLADNLRAGADDGTVSPDDLRALGTLRGTAFDRRWLTLMVGHHEGAVRLAQEEVRTGRHAGARDLARRVVEQQQAEAEQMRALLAR